MDGPSFEQWVLFVAVSFRHAYRGAARRAFPHLEPRLPLVQAGKLTVAQVNSGEAVHFIYSATPVAEPTACRSLTIEPSEGLTVKDWALLDGEGYKRFVERSLGCDAVGHFVLFPGDDDGHATAVLEGERLARAHAKALTA